MTIESLKSELWGLLASSCKDNPGNECENSDGKKAEALSKLLVLMSEKIQILTDANKALFEMNKILKRENKAFDKLGESFNEELRKLELKKEHVWDILLLLSELKLSDEQRVEYIKRLKDIWGEEEE